MSPGNYAQAIKIEPDQINSNFTKPTLNLLKNSQNKSDLDEIFTDGSEGCSEGSDKVRSSKPLVIKLIIKIKGSFMYPGSSTQNYYLLFFKTRTTIVVGNSRYTFLKISNFIGFTRVCSTRNWLTQN